MKAFDAPDSYLRRNYELKIGEGGGPAGYIPAPESSATVAAFRPWRARGRACAMRSNASRAPSSAATRTSRQESDPGMVAASASAAGSRSVHEEGGGPAGYIPAPESSATVAAFRPWRARGRACAMRSNASRAPSSAATRTSRQESDPGMVAASASAAGSRSVQEEGGGPAGYIPAPESSATVAAFRPWRSSQTIVAGEPTEPPLNNMAERAGCTRYILYLALRAAALHESAFLPIRRTHISHYRGFDSRLETSRTNNMAERAGFEPAKRV